MSERSTDIVPPDKIRTIVDALVRGYRIEGRGLDAKMNADDTYKETSTQ